MALIGEYQRSPQLAAAGQPGAGLDEDRGDDATSASYTELPASYKPVSRRKPVPGRKPEHDQSRGMRVLKALIRR